MPIHKRRFLFALEFTGLVELINRLQEIDTHARTNGHVPVEAVEMQKDGDAGRLDVWEETLSDQSTQLVVMFA